MAVKVLRSLVLLGLGMAAALVALEAGLRLLPVNSGLVPRSEGPAWPLRAYEPVRPYGYSQGWAMLNARRGVTNNYGHIAPFDYWPGSRPWIVVGDSFVESLMNDHADTVQGMLGAERGPTQPVYGLGVSGFSVADYIVMARRARAEFAPRAVVFAIIDGDFSGALQPWPGGYHLAPRGAGLELAFTPRTPSPLVQRVRQAVGDLALYDYVRGNLKFSPADVTKVFRAQASSGGGVDGATRDAHAQAATAVARWFLDELPAATGVPARCTVLLLDADRYALYERREARPPEEEQAARQMLIERGRELGFRVIDLGPLFLASYAADRRKLDHWPIDRHWNRRGHEVAARAAMSALVEGGSECAAAREGGAS
jgi:hypothetical protein